MLNKETQARSIQENTSLYENISSYILQREIIEAWEKEKVEIFHWYKNIDVIYKFICRHRKHLWKLDNHQ